MPRKRKQLGDEVTERIAALTKQGKSVDAIVKQLRADGVEGISRATVGRRIVEQRAGVKKSRAAAIASSTKSSEPKTPKSARASAEPAEDVPLPSSPDEIPADADVATLDAMLRKAEQMAEMAFADGDLEGFGRMGRLVPAIVAAKLKATPARPLDPNENPDMIAARDHARQMFHNLIDKVLPT